MAKSSSTSKNPKYDLSLSDGREIWGFLLENGERDIQEISQTASTLRVTGGGGRFGDFDPTFSHIEQRTWHGGRGSEDFSEDPTRFYDSLAAWTMTPQKLFPGPLWYIPTGLRTEDRNLWGDSGNSDDIRWVALLSSEQYVEQSFDASATYSADKTYLLIRKIGSPGTLTVELTADSTGDPGTAAQTVTLSASTLTDEVSVFYPFDWTGTESLTSGTTYHVKIYGASADSKANHWEVAVDDSTDNAQTSSDDSTWSGSPGFSLYFRVVDADDDARWHFAQTSSDLWAISEQDDGGTSEDFVWNETNDGWDAKTLTGTALSGSVSSVCVQDDIVIMARGSGATIFHARNNSGTYQGEAESTNNADHVYTFYDPVDGVQVWRAENDAVDISRADATTWSSDLSFGTEISVGDDTADIIGLVDYNDQLWARKQDSLWTIKNDRASRLPADLDRHLESASFAPLLSKDLFLYLGWSYSVERLYGGTLDDVGPWKDAGLPGGRQGRVTALESGIGMLFAAIDGGSSGTSSVLVFDGQGYHEIFRGWETGKSIKSLHFQATSGQRSRLHIGIGSDIVYLPLPEHTLNPIKDSGYPHIWESHIVTSYIDMANAALPKMFKSLTMNSENLGSGTYVALEYQLDDDIGGTSWLSAEEFYSSPEANLPIDRGNARRIRFRLRMICNDADDPPIINATVLKAFARTPFKRQWNVRVKIGPGTITRNNRGGKGEDGTALYNWLVKAADRADKIIARSKYPALDGMVVTINPPSYFRNSVNTFQGWERGVAQFSIMEAEG